MTAAPRNRALALGVVVVAILAAAGGYVLWSMRPPTTVGLVETTDDAGIEAWCAETLSPVRGGGCLAIPLRASATVPLLVYLHGRYSPKTLADELERQKRVARLGTSRGFAVLAMRGVQGECTQPELADTWCWPSNPRVADHGAAFVARFEPAIAAAKARIGAGPTVLLGFSNGAYFATLIATRALRPFDAIAIAHGGPVPPTRSAGSTPPLLLITADDDPSDGEMQQLHAELTHLQWAHELVGREGGHALPEWDVNIALTFFERALAEKLPLSPPLQAPRPRPQPSPAEEAGEEEGDETDDGAAAPSDPSDIDDAP